MMHGQKNIKFISLFVYFNKQKILSLKIINLMLV